MFEIPDDDDLFNEDNLSLYHLTETNISINQHHDEAEPQTSSRSVLQTQSSATVHQESPKASVVYGQWSESPQTKKMRVLTDINHRSGSSAASASALKPVIDHATVDNPRPATVHCTSRSADPSTPAPSVHTAEADASEPARKRSLRKFPGPAGILPPAKPSELASVLKKNVGGSPEVVTDTDVSKPGEEVCSSQSGLDVFGGAAWQSLLADLEPGAEDILRKFSVRAMLHKASRKLLPKGKIPLLLGVLDSIDFQGTDASVVLRDRTGQMQGTLHRDVFKDFAMDLQTGAAVVLRQVSVISPSSRTHYLNITGGNIVAIYPASGERIHGVSPSALHPQSHSAPSKESVKDFVHAAELELLQAANAAKEAAVSRLRQQRSAAAATSPATAGGRVGQGGQRLFSNTPRVSSPSFSIPQRPMFSTPQRPMFSTPQRPTFTPSPAASGSGCGRFTFRNAHTSSQQRTPTPASRMPVGGVNSPAPSSGQNTSVNNMRISHQQRPTATGHSAPSRIGGVGGGVCDTDRVQGGTGRIQPPSASNSPAVFHGTPVRPGGNSCFTSQTGTPVSSRFSAPPVSHTSSSHKDVLQSERVAGSNPQESRWSFKRKSSGPPLPTAAGAASNSVNQVGQPAAKVHITSSQVSQPGGSGRPQQPGSGNRGHVSAAPAAAAPKVSANMWDDELDDDILSQLSDDF